MESMMDFKRILLKYLKRKNSHSSDLAELVTQIKQDWISGHGKRLTNFTPEQGVRLGVAELNFNYKRDVLDLNLAKKDLRFLGIKNDIHHVYRPYLLNSGQAGINVVMNYLKFNQQVKKIECFDNVYIGALRLSRILKLPFKFESNASSSKKALWICSSYFNLEKFQQHLKSNSQKHYDHVVIDTTCWSVDSDVLVQIIKHFKKSHLYLIRSSSKLDMGGIEYGSLGSLVVGVPSKSSFDSVTSSFEILISLTASTPSLDDIPPYLFDKDFLRFTNKRILEMEKITQTIKNKNSWRLPPSVSTVFPEHSKYFFILLETKKFKNKKQLLRTALEKSFIFAGMTYKELPNFGFDDCILSFYEDEKTNKQVLRLCPGIGEKRAEKIIMAIEIYMQFLGSA